MLAIRKSWKLDQYVRNNPLRYTDPSRADCRDASGEPIPCSGTSTGASDADWNLWVLYLGRQSINAANDAVQVTEQAVSLIKQFFTAPRRRGCVANSTANWSNAFAVIGGVARLAGLVGGPAVVATVPAGIVQGGAIGGAVGGAIVPWTIIGQSRFGTNSVSNRQPPDSPGSRALASVRQARLRSNAGKPNLAHRC